MLGTSARRPQGTKRVLSSSIGNLVMWRLFFGVCNSASATLKIKLLAHSGHGSVSCLSSNIPRVYERSASVARVTFRRISGYPALGPRQLTSANSCRACSLSSDEPE